MLDNTNLQGTNTTLENERAVLLSEKASLQGLNEHLEEMKRKLERENAGLRKDNTNGENVRERLKEANAFLKARIREVESEKKEGLVVQKAHDAVRIMPAYV